MVDMMVVECVVNAAFKVVFFFYIKPDEFRSVCWDTHSVITEKKDKTSMISRDVCFFKISLSRILTQQECMEGWAGGSIIQQYITIVKL